MPDWFLQLIESGREGQEGMRRAIGRTRCVFHSDESDANTYGRFKRMWSPDTRKTKLMTSSLIHFQSRFQTIDKSCSLERHICVRMTTRGTTCSSGSTSNTEAMAAKPYLPRHTRMGMTWILCQHEFLSAVAAYHGHDLDLLGLLRRFRSRACSA